MVTIKKVSDPIKKELISYFEEKAVPADKEAVRDMLIKTLQRPDIVISDFSKRKNINRQDVIKEVAEFLDKTLTYFYQDNLDFLAEQSKPRRRK